MYRNIIFDLGGVVVDYDPRAFLVDHFMNEKLEEQLYELTFGSHEWWMLDADQITREEANEIFRARGKEIGRSFEMDVILTDWVDMLKTRDDTVQLMKRLKKRGYRLYYLSNIPKDVLELMRQRKFWAMFDGGVASCRAKMNKPDPRIYLALLYRYRLRPEETIFLDDNRENVAAARELGLAGIHFRSLKHALAQMIKLGVSFDKKAPPIAQPAPAPAPQAAETSEPPAPGDAGQP